MLKVYLLSNNIDFNVKKEYNFVYLTNTPSFYKLNLCNEIAKTNSLLLVLYGYGSEAVNTQMESKKWTFDYIFINKGNSSTRSKTRTFIALLKLMRKVKAKKVLFAGWMAPEYNLYSFISPKSKNVVICESSIYDVKMTGLTGCIKKYIISRMSAALPSGKPHDKLFESIGFKGRRNITGSVGIFHKPGRTLRPMPSGDLKYIYVGRLVDVKNLEFLIEAFNANGKSLTIVGKGELEGKLKAMAKPNITFIGFVPNEELGAVYQAHDVFVLPSKYEPWGLVVEEAIYWGLPVIVSDRVGSGIDMVKYLGTGEIFYLDSVESLQEKIGLIESRYAKYKENVDKVDFDLRDKSQVKAFTSIIEKLD